MNKKIENQLIHFTFKKSIWYESMKILFKNKLAVCCGAFIFIMILISLFANQISPYPFDQQNLNMVFSPSSWKHWLGTDDLGRDLLSRLIYGSRVSMSIGILSSLMALILGAFYGSISGWFGGRVDAVMMRFLDIMYSIPLLVLIIIIKIIFESTMDIDNPELRSVMSMLIALSISGWMTLGRVVRGQVLQLKNSLYVEAARALGATHSRILLKQILPNMMGPIIVLLTMQMPLNILSESFLSFLGLGLQPPYSSWGILSNEGWRLFRIYPHLMIAPGVCLFLTCLSFNLLGDGLQDALNPSSKGKK